MDYTTTPGSSIWPQLPAPSAARTDPQRASTSRELPQGPVTDPNAQRVTTDASQPGQGGAATEGQIPAIVISRQDEVATPSLQNERGKDQLLQVQEYTGRTRDYPKFRHGPQGYFDPSKEDEFSALCAQIARGQTDLRRNQGVTSKVYLRNDQGRPGKIRFSNTSGNAI